MNKAVIFDLDGTLIDSLPDIYNYVCETLEKFGAKKRDYDQVRSFIGNGAKNLIKRSFGDDISEEDLKVRLDYYNEKYTSSGSPLTKPFDGIKDLLIELKKRGYKLGILTNKPQETTESVCEKYLSDVGFDAIKGAKSGIKIKPDPEALFMMLNELDVQPENAYFVGDGETEVITALNAGAKGISVLWGYRTKEELTAAGATTFAEKPLDLLNIIR
jgi:phosphoglycolate phosphatase